MDDPTLSLPFVWLWHFTCRFGADLFLTGAFGGAAGALVATLGWGFRRALGWSRHWRAWPVYVGALLPLILSGCETLPWVGYTLIGPLVVLLVAVPTLAWLSQRRKVPTIAGWLLPLWLVWIALTVVPRRYSLPLTELAWSVPAGAVSAESESYHAAVALSDLLGHSVHLGVVGLVLAWVALGPCRHQPARSAELGSLAAWTFCVAGLLDTVRALMAAHLRHRFDLARIAHDAQSDLLWGIAAVAVVSLLRRHLRKERAPVGEALVGRGLWVLGLGLTVLLATQQPVRLLAPRQPHRMVLVRPPVCPQTSCSGVAALVPADGRTDFPVFPPDVAVVDVRFRAD